MKIYFFTKQMNVFAILPLRWIPSLRQNLEYMGWRCDQIILQFLFSYLCNTNFSCFFLCFVLLLLFCLQTGCLVPIPMTTATRVTWTASAITWMRWVSFKDHRPTRSTSLRMWSFPSVKHLAIFLNRHEPAIIMGDLNLLPNSGAVLDFSSHYPHLALPMAGKNGCCNTTYPGWVRLT